MTEILDPFNRSAVNAEMTELQNKNQLKDKNGNLPRGRHKREKLGRKALALSATTEYVTPEYRDDLAKNAPSKEVVDHNLENYPEAHRAEVVEAFNQSEAEEQKSHAA